MSQHPYAARPGATHRGARLVPILLAVLAGLLASPAHAGDAPVPEGTSNHIGLPPYGPFSAKDKVVVAAWGDACVALAGEEGATRHAADLLFSAADAFHYHVLDRKRAGQLYAQAAALYAHGDITRGVLLIRWLGLEVGRGNQPEATRALEALQAYVERRTPRDVEETEALRWEVWERERRRDLPQHVAAHHEADGRFREAAEIRERLAEEETDLLARARRRRLLERAARSYHRAGMKDAAVRAVTAAMALVDDEAQKATLAFWRLYAEHGLLSAEGYPLVTDRWPDESFEDDVRAFLREIQGVEGVGTKYLALGSRAYAAKRYEIALEIYMLALRDPSLVAEARKDSSIWRGLLMGYSAAMELERFDEAEQILEIVERVADEPIADKDDYVLAVAKARAWVAGRPLREEARRKLAAARSKRAKREAERRRRARIETGEGGAAEDEPGLDSAADDDQAAADGPFLLVLAALLALCIVVVVIVRRARR